jgi:hypothetical protein
MNQRGAILKAMTRRDVNHNSSSRCGERPVWSLLLVTTFRLLRSRSFSQVRILRARFTEFDLASTHPSLATMAERSDLAIGTAVLARIADQESQERIISPWFRYATIKVSAPVCPQNLVHKISLAYAYCVNRSESEHGQRQRVLPLPIGQ